MSIGGKMAEYVKTVLCNCIISMINFQGKIAIQFEQEFYGDHVNERKEQKKKKEIHEEKY